MKENFTTSLLVDHEESEIPLAPEMLSSERFSLNTYEEKTQNGVHVWAALLHPLS